MIASLVCETIAEVQIELYNHSNGAAAWFTRYSLARKLSQRQTDTWFQHTLPCTTVAVGRVLSDNILYRDAVPAQTSQSTILLTLDEAQIRCYAMLISSMNDMNK